jgi:hypothetical protein
MQCLISSSGHPTGAPINSTGGLELDGGVAVAASVRLGSWLAALL